MTIRVAAVEVSHWHALNDAAYLRHLIAMPDVELVAIQDSDAGLVAKRAAEVKNPPTFTDRRKMIEQVRPDFVVALGRHSQMAAVADELRSLYGSKGVTPDKDVIAYCRIGERSSHTWFVLHELLGFERVRNYDGSWTEYGSLVGVPIEKGATA